MAQLGGIAAGEVVGGVLRRDVYACENIYTHIYIHMFAHMSASLPTLLIIHAMQFHISY